MKDSVLSLKEKQNSIGLLTFKLPASTIQLLRTDTYNSIFDNFGI